MSPPNLYDMIRRLIETPSVSSVNPQWDQANLGVVDLLSQWLGDLGFKVEILPVPGHPGKFNLIANAGSGPEGLVLAGHTDTVPYDDRRWRHDPFKLVEADNRLYGLGSSDMKAFFALVIEAVRDLPLGALKHPLTILATADEESGMWGAQSLAEMQRRLGRYAVIGEPTGLTPVRMHKGIAMEAIRLTGRAGHSSDPALGNSALEGMHRVMGALLGWRAELQNTYRNPLFKVAVPTLNLGHIHGGDNPNRICAECELQIDLRFLPGMPLESLQNELRARVTQALEGTGLGVEVHPLFDGIPAMETPVSSAIVQAAEKMTGRPAQAVAFATEGPYLGRLGLETLILGPGDVDQAHQPDEFLSLERIQPCIDLLKSLIRRFCL